MRRIDAYPADLVERVRSLYEEGHTMREVAVLAGTTVRVLQRLMPLHGIDRRRRGARDQSGERNPTWKGRSAGMDALHLRVAAARGTPSECDRCGTTEDRRYEWANLSGRYGDTADYARMCVPCHRRFDAERRRTTGQLTSVRVDA